jgi:RNA polymerase sigma-70 factor (ECF subfamily)
VVERGEAATRSDADLAAAFQMGDSQAFAALYERHKRSLFAFAFRMLGDVEGARDLVQDAFVTVLQHREELERPGSFRSWLFAIGRNACLSRLRRDRGQVPLEDAPEEAIAIEPPADGVEVEEEERSIRRALGRLRIEHREVLILREYQGLSYREIAAVTRSTESAVKSRLWKARQALVRAMAPGWTGSGRPETAESPGPLPDGAGNRVEEGVEP